jgi:hypothetical protein
MISILITIIIALVLLYLARLVIAALGLPSPIDTIIYVVLGLIVFLYFLSMFGLLPAGFK